MPKRTDIQSILLIGSGPIVIGQACEFDYSGTQACKALRSDGYKTILVNSNPATIMTDPSVADRTYIEPIEPKTVAKIIEKERPDALLPTLGGQTALNTAVALAADGTLEKFGVKLIGANLDAINKAESREQFKEAVLSIGLRTPKSGLAHNMREAWDVVEEIGFPAIIRSSFTLGGSGGSIAYNREEFPDYAGAGLDSSPISEILIEESVLGWKEFELEVMRDLKDNVVIICSIENLDPMGVHTGDSITVAPAQTLTDKEYQSLRDASVAIIREIGVDTGGSNIQFAVNPENGEFVVIEMNPRVSRSSALASKATGFPIAKIAAKLAVGYTLDEISNDITRYTPASFEPAIDYVVTKIPRFAFEKFPDASSVLTTQMKSVGEAMAIGRTFKESLQKAMRSLEADRAFFEPVSGDPEQVRQGLGTPGPNRLWLVADALRLGFGQDEIHRFSSIDPWFIRNIAQIVEQENVIEKHAGSPPPPDILRESKEKGFSDVAIASLVGITEDEVRDERARLGILPSYKMVDTCAAEFESYTPYLYSTYDSGSEAPPGDSKKVMILGGGPNRIGQGIEFDYCCVHAAMAMKERGYETIMVNCNPETVSTDYDTSDRLYFEPLTFEDVLSIIDREKPEGVIVNFGGQTPLNLAVPLEKSGVKIMGTPPDSIDLAEDRERFNELVSQLGLKQPGGAIAKSPEDAARKAAEIGYPVVVRPSYVLGGRAMEIVYKERDLVRYINEAAKVSPNRPILIDEFMKHSGEVDVDAVCDGKNVVVGAIMEHIEEAGVHSGDSAMITPPVAMSEDTAREITAQTKALALALGVRGLVNVQFAVRGGEVFIIEVNPRASRTVPFVSKAIGVPLAKVATRVMSGMTLEEAGLAKETAPRMFCVKESVFPFARFPGVDTILGPEMKSTGEVMGMDEDGDRAFAKSQIAAGNPLPVSGTAFISVRDEDKNDALADIARRLEGAGFEIAATAGTARFLSSCGVSCSAVKKVKEGRPNIVDLLKNGGIQLVINTTTGKEQVLQSFSIRRTSLMNSIAYFTTIEGARAAAGAIAEMVSGEGLSVVALQDFEN